MNFDPHEPTFYVEVASSNDDTPAKDALRNLCQDNPCVGLSDDWIKIAFFRPRVGGYAEQFDGQSLTLKIKLCQP